MEYSYIDVVMLLLRNTSLLQNSSLPDIRKPFIKSSVENIYPLFIFLHVLVFAVGAAGNLSMLVFIIRKRLYRNPTYMYMCNLGVSDTFNVAVVMPFTLTNLVLQNWIFGGVLCYVLPVLQSLPIHVSILTYMMLATDRCRFIVYPMKSRLPPVLCIIVVWIISVCAVLPKAVYTTYQDLGDTVLGPEFQGSGICWFNLGFDTEKYIRAIFVIMFCLPLGIIASLFIKVSMELDVLSSPTSSIKIDNASRNSEASYHSHVTWLSNENQVTLGSDLVVGSDFPHRKYSLDTTTEGEDDGLDMHKEKRAQRYLVAMVTGFAVCWLPVKILNMVTHFVQDDSDNMKNYDITYIMFTFIGFVSTCINPLLFTFWRMSINTRKQLCDYLKLSKRDSCSNCARPIMSSDMNERSYNGVNTGLTSKSP